jgi:hypothetical protein
MTMTASITMCRVPTAWDELQAERNVKEFGARFEGLDSAPAGLYRGSESERVRGTLEALACSTPRPDSFKVVIAGGNSFRSGLGAEFDALIAKDTELRDGVALLLRRGWNIAYTDQSVQFGTWTNPDTKTINLSPELMGPEVKTAVSALAHEVTHALEYEAGALNPDAHLVMGEDEYIAYHEAAEARADFREEEVAHRLESKGVFGSAGNQSLQRQVRAVYDKYLVHGNRDAAIKDITKARTDAEGGAMREAYRNTRKLAQDARDPEASSRSTWQVVEGVLNGARAWLNTLNSGQP